jgi:ribosomal protein L13
LGFYKKYTNKIYYRHTGHPGGIKENTPLRLAEKNKIDDVLKLAVKRMLPGGPLAKKQLSKLKVYRGKRYNEVGVLFFWKFEKLQKMQKLYAIIALQLDKTSFLWKKSKKN